ncbi:uncharacterized protein L3040_002423 [Drepanopeziza brunnea f. sp. 'multigermtubi']|uniref:DnaJ domain-containing protein n=1 Tax=Marssonina brunnea f. sp. multigermtubi (strain MB_m1) TaxID=1072389 RepID=K1WQH4_MARBU|nr:DnaJ domain-containing protein [Drepanopeziza brunnea f. sp. 'multigermtubi' MB_m1]EKD19895.1 DnaJ domain-containing protein [Drepanopeziza brunnea f. sp. 'multigermtubi' MB_m1]KAJ5050546.1 hypothetical protein L3040_002423 [Drepanopeziza brunnea f. sp. 'multigermtubi']
MARKTKKELVSEDSGDDEEVMASEEELEAELDEPPSIEPYQVLGIERSATESEIKSAYRKAALRHHPDKAAPHRKDEAHTKFQEVAFAYAVLSDPIRRKRYDKTGSTSESISVNEDFSWTDFYSEQFRDVVTVSAIEEFAKTYKGSDEERDDVVAAYKTHRGSWNKIYQTVMLSDCLEDEDRFRGYIDEAIEKGDATGFPAYLKETPKQKAARMKAARKEAEEEAAEADVYGKELKAKKEEAKGLEDLAALIQNKHRNTGSSFLDALEAKAKAEQKSKHGKRKEKVVDEDEDMEEPSEEAFLATAAKMQKGSGASEGRKSKRGKH